MKKMLITVLALFVMTPIAASCDDGQKQQIEVQGNYTEPLYIQSTETGKTHQFYVEIALDPQSLVRGLMYRKSMEPDQGMFFSFAHEAERRFWMKNTYIPLDILFLKSSGIIHHIHENAQPLDETPVPSNGPVLNVLELNGGTAARLGIKPGDMVILGKASKPLAE